MTKKKWELEDFIEQNQRRVYYQMARLQIDEKEGDYFQKGLVAMWRAYENYNPDKGPLTTYMNFQIRNRLVDVFRQSIAERSILNSWVFSLRVKCNQETIWMVIKYLLKRKGNLIHRKL